MRKIFDKLPLLLLMVTCLGAVAQKQPAGSADFILPTGKFKNDELTAYRRVKQKLNTRMGLTYMLCYHQTNFLNDQFVNNIQDGALSYSPGTCLSFRFEYGFPLVFDFNWFSSRFTYEGPNDNPLFETPYIRHRGIEISSNLVLLPVSKSFMPFIGIGYQSASLVASNYWPLDKYSDDNDKKSNTSNQEKEEIKHLSNCSAPIWKVGLSVGFDKLYINAEYKQSLNVSATKAYNQLSIGIGYRP
jgi:hypothetical protein